MCVSMDDLYEIECVCNAHYALFKLVKLSFQYNNEKQHFSLLYNKGGHAVICTVFLL